MAIYIGLAVVTIIAAFFVNNKTAVQANTVTRQQMCNRILLAGIFALLFLVSACRIYVGNDYMPYLNIFERIHNGQVVSTEIGFNAVVKTVQFFFGTGGSAALVIFAIFAFGTAYFMLRAMYEQSEWFVWTFFLFMTSGYYFSSMMTVRYYFVLSIALYAVKYAVKKNWLPFLLWIMFAALFHKSVLFVIPVYWLAGRQWKKWHIWLAVGMCVTFLVFGDFYRRIIFYFYPYYENSIFDTGRTSLVNIAKCVCVLVLALLYYKDSVKVDKKIRFYFYLNLGSLILYVFCSFIPEVSRIGYYLNVTNIFLIPSVLKSIPDKRQRWFFNVVVAVAFCLYFAMFLRDAYAEGIRLLPYQSWLFH